MLASKYLERIDITFLPTAAMPFATEIGAVSVQRPGVVAEIRMTENPRNKDGYRSKLDADIRKLRQEGAVLVDVPNADGKKFLAERTAKTKTESFPTVWADAEGPAKTTDKPSKSAK